MYVATRRSTSTSKTFLTTPHFYLLLSLQTEDREVTEEDRAVTVEDREVTVEDRVAVSFTSLDLEQQYAQVADSSLPSS